MKKIGIITFHASHNYGSVLQAFALSRKLMNSGYHVEIINLRNQAQKKAYKIFKNHDTYLKKIFSIFIYPALKKRFREFERFINCVLPITKKRYFSGSELNNEEFQYDVFICGSDQIWNPNCQDFETAYYLDFVKNKKKKIAYAPSLGKNSFNEEQTELIKNLIQDFDHISVREQQGKIILSELTNKEISVVCDPVLLLESEEWKRLQKKPKINDRYILTYFLENNHGNNIFLPILRKITGYKVIILNEYIRDYFRPYYKAINSSPEEFVGLFCNASFIYTNSFHGTVFATIFNKSFITSISQNDLVCNNNDCRKIDYLKFIGLENRLSTNINLYRENLLNIDYSEVNKKIQLFRSDSINYLVKAIES